MRDSARRLLAALMGSSAGGFLAMPPALDGSSGLGIAALSGSARPRGPWDVLVSTRAPELQAETLTFVVLMDGTIVVDDDISDGAADPLADAVESRLPPPYEAAAVRAEDDVWCVAAHRVLIAGADGPAETLEASRVGEHVTVTIDGREMTPAFLPTEVRALLDGAEGDVVFTGERLDDATWVLQRWAL